MSPAKWILIGITLFVIGTDIYLARQHGGATNTYSYAIYTFALKNPMVVFGAGVLCGHLFWGQSVK